MTVSPCKQKLWPERLFGQRWGAVLGERNADPAVLSPEGAVLRTFQEVEDEALRVAHLLRQVEGGIISLRAANCASWPSLVLGIWRAGGAALLVDAASPLEAVERAEQSCGAVGRLEVGADDVAMFSHIGGEDAQSVDCAVIKLTSGTTSVPRSLTFTEEAIVADCDQVCETMGIRSEDRNYGIISFAHSYGLSNLVTPLLFRGVPLVAAQDALPRALWDGLAASRATVLPAVPAMYRALAGIIGGKGELSVRRCISAGARLPADVAKSFHNRFGRKIHSFYGASECGGICFDDSDDIDVPEGFVGRPMIGVDLRMPPAGESGLVTVQSRALCREQSDGFVPADFIQSTPSGLVLLGREADSVNVAGRKVNPVEVEVVLRRHPAVTDAVVFGAVDARRGERLVALVVWNTAEQLPSLLRENCVQHLAPWQVPREILSVPAIPLTPRGKVSRVDLRARYDAGEFGDGSCASELTGGQGSGT